MKTAFLSLKKLVLKWWYKPTFNKEVMLEILISLLETKHGYQILRELQNGYSSPVGAVWLYDYLNHMQERGLIREVPAPETETDPRKRYYHITQKGLARLNRVRES